MEDLHRMNILFLLDNTNCLVNINEKSCMTILSNEMQFTNDIELAFVNEFFFINTCDRQVRLAITIFPVRE